ncbi:MAG: hypothetical protein ACLVCI_01080 [Varibaculum timonense]
MSAQLSFDFEELTHQRVVGLGDYQMAKRQIATVKRPRLQLVDATYIERARAKSRHPAGSKLPCPKAVGRENRTDGAGAAFDSLPAWVRRGDSASSLCSSSSAKVSSASNFKSPVVVDSSVDTPLSSTVKNHQDNLRGDVPGILSAAGQLTARPTKLSSRERGTNNPIKRIAKTVSSAIIPAISLKLAKISLALILVAGALIAGGTIGTYWDLDSPLDSGFSQLSGADIPQGEHSLQADLLLGQ